MGDAPQRPEPLIGVSPAYFISRYGDRFSPLQVAGAMADIAALGCRGFQLEVYHRESLASWRKDGARMVRRQAEDAALHATQFVAHFMMEWFSTPHHLTTDGIFDQMEEVLEIVDHFDECHVITLPLGPFQTPQPLSFVKYQRLLDLFVTRIAGLLERVEGAQRRLSLEVIPGGMIAGTEGFLRLCDLLASPTLGFNLDSGHAWASKENIYLLPAKLGPRLAGTHLCDNLGFENSSLRPGTGTINWPMLVSALKAAGYEGSYDLEIICPSREVQSEYRKGITMVEQLVQPQTAAA